MVRKSDKEKTADPAAREMLAYAAQEGLETVWDRLERQTPQCRIGEQGICCRICLMGPCRIRPDGKSPQLGVCGATGDTIVARNLIRMVAAGTASHSEQGRNVALLLRDVALGRNREYGITDPDKLRRVAHRLGIKSRRRNLKQLAGQVAEKALDCFSNHQETPLPFLEAYMPDQTRRQFQKAAETLEWEGEALLPRNIDREVVDILHRTHYGTDHEPKNLLAQGVRCALADGWGGSLIATELQDVLFGTPTVQRTRANLGVLDEAAVNLVVHGHEPILSEKIIEAAKSPEMQDLARARGASGVNVVGMCCTVNEALMRQGVEMAGNHLHQELAIMTGAVEALVVDVQCIFPVMADLARCFHTRFITTSEAARFPGSLHIPLDVERAGDIGRRIVRTAIDAFQERDRGKVFIPEQTATAQVGYSVEEIERHLGGRLSPLTEALQSGQIRGIAGLVGCNNPKVPQDFLHIHLTRELLRRNVLVVGTGCWAIGAAKAGLMDPDLVNGVPEGLKQFCRSHDIPPVLHMGSCVDCSRMLLLFSSLAEESGGPLGKMPLVGAAPEWATEKALTIGLYLAASGLPVHLWPLPPVAGSPLVGHWLTEGMAEGFGGYFLVEEDPVAAADRLVEAMDRRRNGSRGVLNPGIV